MSTPRDHHAPHRPAGTGPLVEPLELSVSYRVHSDLGFSVVDRHPGDPFFYRRWGSPAGDALAARITELEGGVGARLFASGMGAISGLLVHRLGAGERLVLSNICYPGVAEFAHHTLERYGVEVVTIDPTRIDEVERALASPTRHVHLEIPANPTLAICDLPAIVEMAHAAGAQVSVDATFAAGVALHPLRWGADWVAHSLTKYMSGHGDALGGAIVGTSQEALAALDAEATVHLGAVMSPLDIHLVARGLSTLALRTDRQFASALTVARWLEEHPRVRRVLHPLLETHPQRAIAEKLGLTGCGMVCFVLDDPAPAATRAREIGMRTVSWAVSLGHDRSLMYYIPSADLLETSYRMDEAQTTRFMDLTAPGVFRLSIGLEDPDLIIADLERVLAGD